jgi:dTMP kinase
MQTAARTEHLIHTVVPALQEGIWVVSDRYVESTVAYHGYGHRQGRKTVMRLHQLATGGLMADLTILLQVSPVVAAMRTAGDAFPDDRFERFGEEFIHRVHEGYAALLTDPDFDAVAVNANTSPNELVDIIMSIIDQRFGLRVVE